MRIRSLTRKQRRRLVAAITFVVLVATILDIARSHGIGEAAKTVGILVVCCVLLIVVTTWEQRGKP